MKWLKWILLVWVIAAGFVGCTHMMRQAFPYIKKGEAYTLETTWGPVVESFGPCWSSGKHRNTCWMKREGLEPEKVGLQTLPGYMVQPGERLGVTYKISATVVESYTVRDKWTRTWMHRTSCWKKDTKCYWPSKGQ